MNKNKSKIILFVATVVVFLFGLIIGTNISTDFLVNKNLDKAETSIMIDYGDRIDIYATSTLPIDTSLIDFLKILSQEKKITLKYKDYGDDLGVFIEYIDNVGNDPRGDKYWQYWVNNRYGQIGVSNYKVRPGDSIEFKFIKGQL